MSMPIALPRLPRPHISPQSAGVAIFVAAAATALFNYSAVAPAVAASPAKTIKQVVVAAPMQEVHIANNGATFLRGATVVSVSAAELMVKVAWGGTTLYWNIPNDPSTHFVGQSGEKIDRGDIHIGDTVMVTGSIVGGSNFTVDAQYVRLTRSS